MSQTSEALSWRSIADLVGSHPEAPVALIGAGLNERSLTPGRCDLGPKAFRAVRTEMPAAVALSGARFVVANGARPT